MLPAICGTCGSVRERGANDLAIDSGAGLVERDCAAAVDSGAVCSMGFSSRSGLRNRNPVGRGRYRAVGTIGGGRSGGG